MTYVFPPSDEPLDPSWLAPLDAVARAVAGNRRYRFFDTSDFMIMGRVVRRRPRPNIVLYKHKLTRRHLNLDDAGHAYRYISPRPDTKRAGRYVPHRDLRAAVDHLDIWELPWMKFGLEEYRCGLSWDEAWRLHPDFEGDYEPGGAEHGDLRLV